MRADPRESANVMSGEPNAPRVILDMLKRRCCDMRDAGKRMLSFRLRGFVACAVVLATAAWTTRGIAQQAAQLPAPAVAPPAAISAAPATAIVPAAPRQRPSLASIPQPGQKQPQARTPEEAAAQKAFLAEQNPDASVQLVEDFLLQYPESEFRESAYQTAMQAYQAKNDLAHLLTYGELTLARNPANLTALLLLSTALAEMTDRNDSERQEKLEEGDQYARQALELIARLHKPPGFPDELWDELRHESESAAHASRGLIALIREDLPKAELELSEAVALAMNPDRVLLYRLGLCYSFQKKYAQALEVLDRATALGGIKIAAGAGKTRDLVAEARDFAAKSLSAAVPAAAPSPAVEAPAAGGSPQRTAVP